MAKTLKIKDIVRGTTRRVNLSFTTDDGTPHDLTGATISLAVTANKNPTSDSDAVIDVDGVVSDAQGGLAYVLLTALNTKVPTGSYRFGAQAVLANGSVIENTGKLRILPEGKVGLS